MTADRDAALRVAALVARGATEGVVFEAVAAEASTPADGEPVVLVRVDGDRGSTVVGGGTGLTPGELATASDPGGDDVPIAVEGRTWGRLVVTGPRGMRADTAERLLTYAELVSGPVAAVHARAERQLLADERSTLRRIHAVAGRGGTGADVLAAIAREGSAWLGGAATALVQVQGDGTFAVTAASPRRSADDGSGGLLTDEVIARAVGSVAPGRGGGEAGDGPVATRGGGPATALAVPVTVAGRVWGVFVAVHPAGPVPPDTEQRLARFTESITPTILSAQARSQLADEQAALRRVAELAARDVPSEQVLGAVALEASALAGVECTILQRYEPDGSTEILALAGAPEGVVVGARGPGDGDGAGLRVWRTGRAARIEDLAAMSGFWPQVAHRYGYTTSVAVPITLQGSLWGTLVAVGRRPELLPAIEEHLTSFAELAATAIAGAQARQDLRMLAEEQAALGRVAGLVVRGAALAEVFAAVAVEASALLGGLAAGLWRREPDDEFVLVANVNCGVAVGFRTPPHRGTTFDHLLRTGEASRIPSFEGTPLADATRQLQIGPTATVPISVEGRLWGAMTTSTWQVPLPTDVEHRLSQFAELAGAAIANAENKAKLMASRARVVATADETRRRLQRDVHDSAQQRLVHTIIALKLARQALTDGAPADTLVAEALVNAEQASSELRDVIRGVLPAALTRGGLRTGLESLVTHFALPVELHVSGPRCTAHTELTAYFVVAEALTNVVKHARAGRAAVSVVHDGRVLTVEVRDDGIGGADPAHGTGLTGLADRVEAIEGDLTLTSPPGEGTVLLVHLPLQPAGADSPVIGS